MRNIVRSRCGMGRTSDTSTYASRSSRRSWERGVGVTMAAGKITGCSDKYAHFLCERFRHYLRVALAEGRCDYLELRLAMEEGYLREILSDKAAANIDDREAEAEPEVEYQPSGRGSVGQAAVRRERAQQLLLEEKEAITAVLSMSRKNKKLYNDYDLYDVKYVCKVRRTAELCGEGIGHGRRWGRDPAADTAASLERRSKRSSIFRFFSSKPFSSSSSSSSSCCSSLSPQLRKEQQQHDSVAQGQQQPPKMDKHVRIDTPRNVEFINPRKPKFGGWRNHP